MTLAEAAQAFILDKKKHRSLGPATVHSICNSYLTSLRSGSRRRSHGGLRDGMRRVRKVAAKKLRRDADAEGR